MIVDAKSVPALDPLELDYCLGRARVADPHGNAPTSLDYCSTWNFDLAAREAWELKANKAANYHDVTIDGRTFAAGQVMKHCQEQADRYRRRLATSAMLYGANSWDSGLPLVCDCDAK